MRILVCLTIVSISYTQGQFDPTKHANWGLVNDEQCGLQPALRIFGGQNARIGEFPWMVLVLTDRRDLISGRVHEGSFCGGSIISRKYVLSAAHCFIDSLYLIYNIRFRTGEYDTANNPDCDENNVCAPGFIEYPVSQFISHPEYEPAYKSHYNAHADIALGKVDSGFIFNDFVLPLCLEYGDLLNQNYVGQIAETIGWGAYRQVNNRLHIPRILQKVSLQIIDQENCTLAVSDVPEFASLNPESLICAGSQMEFSTRGDSGSPMSIVKSVNDDIPRHYQIGVFIQSVAVDDTSWYGGHRPSGYTRVGTFLEWILDEISDYQMTMNILVCFIIAIASYVRCDFDPTQHPNWHLVNDKQCGLQPALKIFGGQDASLGEFPWMVLVITDKKDLVSGQTNPFQCGGSIISEKYILSAAHCFIDKIHETSNIRFRVGEYDFASKPDCDANGVCAPNYIEYPASEVIIHPKYIPNDKYSHHVHDDIALGRVDQGFVFTDYVLPICLEYGYLLHQNYGGLVAQTIGWGIYRSHPVVKQQYPTVLQKVSLEVFDQPTCTRVLSLIRGFSSVNPKWQICAGTHTQYPYIGDSGSPLFIVKSVQDDIPRQFQIGVVISASPAGDTSWNGGRRPSIYTRVASYLQWILDQMKD
ncbi:polyserase-2-like [Nilaparvata lugens]|uniref:polyserase-2-like n=1 Tax=Nilaparvata lugens TaxID=108931 RepID=UPI00193DAC1D|nr:polyserase-2-like [Nilaparvata lugens]